MGQTGFEPAYEKSSLKKEDRKTLFVMDEDELTWESLRFPDGTTYEGLVQNGQAQVRGVVAYPSGDKYGALPILSFGPHAIFQGAPRSVAEGELRDNRPHGFGVFHWRKNGSPHTIYMGQWTQVTPAGRFPSCSCVADSTLHPTGRGQRLRGSDEYAREAAN